jgi:adenylate cyclase
MRRIILNNKDVDLTGVYIKGVKKGLTGIEKHAFILFADIRGFTSFAESLLPYDVIHILNYYFHTMGQVITRYGGYIDNYMGDGLMALFESDDPKDGALRSVQAALEMLEAVQHEIRPYISDFKGKKSKIEIGIGLHFGLVVAGSVGSTNNRRSTVIGDSVNFASRIEAVTKVAGARFLISEETFSIISQKIKVGKTLSVKIPGKKGEYNLYEVVGLARKRFSALIPKMAYLHNK